MSMFGMTFVKSHNAVITAGSDMCMRWWDISYPEDSFVLVSPEKPEQPVTGSLVKHGEFRFRIVDGVEIVHDITPSQHAGTGGKKYDLETGSSSSTSSTSTGHSYHHSNAHHNVITDIATVATQNQSFIVSSSADGVIKIWR